MIMQNRSDRKTALADWLVQQGLVGTGQRELLEGYCHKLIELGIPLMRVHVAQRAFHPQFGGIGFDWLRDDGVSQAHYAHTDTPNEHWLNSPMFALLQNGLGEIRDRLALTASPNRFPMLDELKEQGATDYFTTGLAFEELGEDAPIDPHNTPEGVLISWTTDHPEGFTDGHLDLIRSVLPQLGLALKSASNRQMAQDLLRVYLGLDAGNRVLSGEIQRGSLQKIEAAICYFDLTGFTRLAEQTPGELLIEMLNDYFGLAVETVHTHGGSVLKFMGDGMLAMFDKGGMRAASTAALDVAAELRRQIPDRNGARRNENLPTAGCTVAVHAGEIFYGNIGGDNRLDFTVIGPAVNLTARLSGMHGALGQSVIVSETVVRFAGASRHDMVSLGRVMLRGVSEPKQLFTIYEPGVT